MEINNYESTDNCTSLTDGQSLADLLTIWPIAESFAIHAPVGDLITLGRTSTSLRSSLHGRIPENSGCQHSTKSRQKELLNPEIGRHQTTDWAHLKSIAPFTCSSTTHTRGQRTKPCVYCSKPICDACIVRDSFKHRNENTFKNRLRYFCRECWSEGRPTRSFRYPALNFEGVEITLEALDGIQGDDKPRYEASDFCECTLKDNGWLCLECKEDQNTSNFAPSKLSTDSSDGTRAVQCYGLECKNVVDLGLVDKERRRVCLWCQKPLRRQYGGEDRYAWNLKTIEARARNAESRSRDLEEYNRRRLKVMRMSRQEMRGTSAPGDEKPIFVRHLDTINYRNWTAQSNVPDPEAVWKSKNGYWRYHRGLLCTLQRRCRNVNFVDIGGVTVEEISKATREGGLQYARLNRDMYPQYVGPGVPKIPDHHYSRQINGCLNELKARILDLHFVHGQISSGVASVLKEQYGFEIGDREVEQQLGKWLRAKRPDSVVEAISDGVPEEVISVPTAEEQPAEELQQDQIIIVDDDIPMGVEFSTAVTTTEAAGSDDPPPYMP